MPQKPIRKKLTSCLKMSQNATESNHFLLLRLICATSVVAFHACPAALGPRHYPDWVFGLGFPAFEISVDIFFAISGYLIAASLERRRDLWSFVVARASRILPGVMVSVLLTLTLVALFFTELSLGEFFSSPLTRSFFFRNFIPILRFEAYLPGAFPDNPFKGITNPSLWTLAWEIRMYLLLAVVWKCSTLWKRLTFLRACILVWVAYLLGSAVTRHLPWTNSQLILLQFRFVPVFFGGAILYLTMPKFRPCWILVTSVLAICTVLAFISKPLMYPAYQIALPLTVVWIAHLPWKALVRIRPPGDYSYGVYIHSFPIQQILAHALGPYLSYTNLLLISVPASILAGWVSWEFVEKKFLRSSRSEPIPQTPG